MLKIIKLKTENKILRQRLISAKTVIDRINYMFNNSLGLHEHDENIIDQDTFDLYKSKLSYVEYANELIKSNCDEIIKLRKWNCKC